MFLDPVVLALAYPVCWWLFISGMDELFIDAWFAALMTFGRDSWRLSLRQLDETPQKLLAVLVPLWHEHAVIEQMINHNVAAVDYGNYEIFLGVYPNDPRTLEKALLLEEKYGHVHRAVCPHDGPTNKADCLNWIYQRMKLEEEARGVRYQAIVQHDAEDIIHPKAFKLINHLLDENDMVQIPVFPLEMPARYVTHGTYCDEFAEYQVKDIYTRQSIGGFVPSAGVGTAFRREALDEIAAHYRNQIYNVTTLTEDYEIGLKFRLHGKRQFLVRKALPWNGRNGNGHNGDGGGNGRGNGRSNGRSNGKAAGGANGGGRANGRSNGKVNGNGRRLEFVATREYFPHTFAGAVRQKSRWVMGVSLQTWEHRGWRGPLSHVYWYWRDRKGLVGNIVSLLSNLIFAYCLAMWAGAGLFSTGWSLANVFPPSGAIWWLIPVNTFFIFERMVFKVYAVNKIYGARQAAAAVARAPWANLVNFASTIHAILTYLKARFLRSDVKWAKTAHAFPTREQLLEYKRRLGELLVEDRAVGAVQLEEALAEQEESGGRLGEVLVRLGLVDERQLAQALGRQQNIEVRDLDAEPLDPEAARLIPRELAEQWNVLAVGFGPDGSLVVASPEVLTEERQRALEESLALRLVPVLATAAGFAAALERAYPADRGKGAGG